MLSQQDSFTAFYTFFLIKKKILISIFYDESKWWFEFFFSL